MRVWIKPALFKNMAGKGEVMAVIRLEGARQKRYNENQRSGKKGMLCEDHAAKGAAGDGPRDHLRDA